MYIYIYIRDSHIRMYISLLNHTLLNFKCHQFLSLTYLQTQTVYGTPQELQYDSCDDRGAM